MKRFWSFPDVLAWYERFACGPVSILKRVEHNYDLVYRIERNRAGAICFSLKGSR